MITAEMVRQIITDHDANRPRSKQTAVGPSDLSSPCSRGIAYQLLDVDPVTPGTVNLAAWVGTQMHTGMEAALAGNPDWRTEQRVVLDLHDGLSLQGTLDAYHVPTKTVVDWKSVGPSALAKYRARSPEGYLTQVALYGLLAVLSGRMNVEHTALVYVPRNGDLSDIHVDTHPWDPDRADQAIRRLENLHAAVKAGPGVLPLIPTADDCRFCRWWNPNAWADGVGCPGHQDPPQAVGGNPTQQEKETTP